MDRISTGNAEADLILGGGFPRASINLVMGLPGTGKTIFAEQLAFANSGGERPVVFLEHLVGTDGQNNYLFAELSLL